MTKKVLIIIISIFLNCCCNNAQAQNTEILILKDGTEIYGIIEKSENGRVKITDTNGDTFIFSASEISGIMTIKEKNKLSKKAKYNASNNTLNSTNLSRKGKHQNWTSISISYIYSPLKLGAYKIDLHGISLEATRAFNLTNKLPIYFETGASIQWRHNSKPIIAYDFPINSQNDILLLNIPINLLYKHTFNQVIAIEPFIGISPYITIYEHNIISPYKKETYSLMKIFQMDFRFGCNLTFKNISLGVNYGIGLIKQAKIDNVDNKPFNTTTVSLKYIF